MIFRFLIVSRLWYFCFVFYMAYSNKDLKNLEEFSEEISNQNIQVVSH